jgi:FAD dependent oxidoreductase TIGR03364
MHAFLAHRAGAQVVQLDRHVQPEGASVRNFGLVWVSGRSPGAELRLALRARELWEELGHEVPGVRLRANGSITVASSEAELEVLISAVGRADADDRQLSLLDADEVRRVNPGLRGMFLAGLHCAADGAVEPRLATAAMRERLGASDRYRYLAPREVVDVDDYCAVDDTGERHHADLVVLCMGATSHGAAGRLLHDDSLQRVRLHMAETEPLARPLTTSVADGNSLRYYPAFAPASTLLAPRDEALARYGIQLLCQQRLDGSLTIGDSHEYDEPFGFDLYDEPLERIHELARTIIGEPFPQIRRRWVGVYHQLRRVTEGELYFRRVVAPGVVTVGGAGGRGMTLAPAIAEDTFL